MVNILAESTLDYDLVAMAIFLAMIIFVPLAATLSVFYFIPLYGFVIFFSVLAAGKELPVLPLGA
jgi:hypothetical protein